MTMRRAFLALAFLASLSLLGWQADAGITPSFTVARVDSFQQGVWPDANFAGCEDAPIQHGSVAGLTDSLNCGSYNSAGVGGATAGNYRRTLMRWTFGSYLPATALLDSAFLRVTVSAVTSMPDTVLCAIVLKPWVCGTGDGTLDNAADSSGVMYKYYNRLIADARTAANADSAWNKTGCDSGLATFGGITMPTPLSQSLLGKLTYDGAQDKMGGWFVVGIITGTGVMTLNVTEPMRYLINSNRATQNYGMIFRLANGEGGSKRAFWHSSEAATASQRPILVLHWHDVRSPIILGGGQ